MTVQPQLLWITMYNHISDRHVIIQELVYITAPYTCDLNTVRLHIMYYKYNTCIGKLIFCLVHLVSDTYYVIHIYIYIYIYIHILHL